MRANKTNINQNSVISIIRHAKQTRSLYEDMLAAVYTDGEFPAWWYIVQLELQKQLRELRRRMSQQKELRLA